MVGTIAVGIWGPAVYLIAKVLGINMETTQGFLIGYVGISFFVVTLASTLGFQGLVRKIVGIYGAINMRDPFMRGITTESQPSTPGWALAAAYVAILLLALTASVVAIPSHDPNA
ncbi:hypothetical protein CLV78_10613 [Aliiruegeria haliotis]|uniref:Uncharacterized protein n=1 Tax=Aliiruegeria haliotis TaxID=1280846 RepID=A0A2T0RMY8_9RHOB|nr:hypothetical protein [Aliiruegeria haliotis]PRY22473.1 hypothetical protein CLV78_10613 [Aliiruegeria haliotis]